ncbi:hypothetical protein MMC19_000753 [Ptychographa xylographoides]|nr:hypothetical protein [Ptychographa xylographoides]
MIPPPTPITIITGFLGSGKTTLILNLIPQLPRTYKLALLKNEFGDLAIDSQLAASSAISGVQELLNGCICCNLVGQLGDALSTLRNDVCPDRIIIETSGSAFPATLAMEVNRLGRETGQYVLDGVIVVIDVENWTGYEDTSFTAKLQARFTDLVVFNKWEACGERRFEEVMDRLGDLDVAVASVKSDKGKVEQSIVLGLDSAMAKMMGFEGSEETTNAFVNGHSHDHGSDHHSEVEVLSVTLTPEKGQRQGVDLEGLAVFLSSAPKDELYRIKAIVAASVPPTSSDGNSASKSTHATGRILLYILNWAFGRWTFTSIEPSQVKGDPSTSNDGFQDDWPSLRMTIISARYEAEKWKKRLLTNHMLRLENSEDAETLHIERIS